MLHESAIKNYVFSSYLSQKAFGNAKKVNFPFMQFSINDLCKGRNQ